MPDPTPADAIRLALKVCEENIAELQKEERWCDAREKHHWADIRYELQSLHRRIVKAAKQAGIEVEEKEG